jgi:phosphoribosyl-AMP cyclohydrolase
MSTLRVKWDCEHIEAVVDQLDFSKLNGLVTVITQDWHTNEILMCAFANRDAILQSLTTGLATYYSRSQNRLWQKGETSGHIQEIKEIYIDCDDDTVLFKVEQKVAACHKGYRSCFYRRLNENGELDLVREKVFDPSEVY